MPGSSCDGHPSAHVRPGKEQVRDALYTSKHVAERGQQTRVAAASFPPQSRPSVWRITARRRLIVRLAAIKLETPGHGRGGIEAISKRPLCLLPQFVIVIPPIERDAVDVCKASRIPRAVMALRDRFGLQSRRAPPMRRLSLPTNHNRTVIIFVAPAARRKGQTVSRPDRLPCHRRCSKHAPSVISSGCAAQGIPPAAPKPGMVYLSVRFGTPLPPKTRLRPTDDPSSRLPTG